MVVSRVLRIRRTDDTEQAYVLVNVEQNGPSELDLRLTGTDGSSPFVSSVKHSAIHGLRSKGCTGTSEEWIAVLKAILLQDDDVLQSDVAHGLEAVATIESQLHIVIRKNTGGITQRFGSIALQQDDEVEISLYDWAADAVHASDGLRGRLHELQNSVNEQKAIVSQLNTQINELVRAKKEHEDQLVHKFSELLNTKKLKIRDQQRLLSAAKVDPRIASEVQDARGVGDGRAAGASGRRKRKAQATQEDESDDEDGFEVSARNADDEEDELREELQEAGTPEASDEDDQTEDEGGLMDGSKVPAVHSQTSQSGTGKRGKALADAGVSSKSPRDSEPLHPPPRRELPFARKPTERAASPTRSGDAGRTRAAAAPDNDDEETDDEL